MQIFRISHGPYSGLIGVRCDDETSEIFQSAKSVALGLLGLASSSEAKDSSPEEIQQYLKSVGHGDYHWQFLQAPGASGLGLGSNQKKYSRAAFLALALHKASKIAPNQVPEILKDPLLRLSRASDLEVPKKETWTPGTYSTWEQPQPETSQDFEQIFEAAWKDCEHWLYDFNANSMPDILELRHVEVLRQRNCLIPRKPTHNILMAARGLMMVELQSCGQDVIYKSLADRPWQAIVAGMADNIRSDFVGPGIKEFRLEMRRKERCPYTRDPMAIFVAVREDGRKAIHHPHATKDERLRFEDEDGVKFPHQPTKDEIVRAFRLATSWSVQNRWTAFQTGVFQGILRRFKRHFRPEGFCLTDFQLGTRVQAWELAPSVKVKFLEFLQNGCQGQNDLTNSEGESDADADNILLANTLHLHQTGTTQEWQIESEVQHETGYGSHDSTRGWDRDSSWWSGWQSSSWDSSWRSGSQWAHGTGSWQGSEQWDAGSWQSWQSWEFDDWNSSEDVDLNTLHQEALSNLGLGDPQEKSMQSTMINEFLRSEISGSGQILASLDPSRDDRAETTYAWLIREIDVSRLRYSHDNISRKFLHGPHKGQNVETLSDDLWHDRLRTADVKPLVAVSWKGAVWVICGNRRCHAMKSYVYWLGSQNSLPVPKARVILHDFPRLSGIRDEQVRWAFMLKAVSSMSTRSEGLDVQVGRTFR